MTLKLTPVEFKQLTNSGQVTVTVKIDTKWLSYSNDVRPFVVDESCDVEFPAVFQGVQLSNVLKFVKEDGVSSAVFAPTSPVNSTVLLESAVSLLTDEAIVDNISVIAPQYLSGDSFWKWQITVKSAGHR